MFIGFEIVSHPSCLRLAKYARVAGAALRQVFRIDPSPSDLPFHPVNPASANYRQNANQSHGVLSNPFCANVQLELRLGPQFFESCIRQVFWLCLRKNPGGISFFLVLAVFGGMLHLRQVPFVSLSFRESVPSVPSVVSLPFLTRAAQPRCVSSPVLIP
jgi:hypothetical protein